ncbi:MAG: nuclear transport factor 2 family protein [Flavobacteriaceae bacterium]|nr:nuclear transport factor 2 family protein [Flavobacteriaceae bacterium]
MIQKIIFTLAVVLFLSCNTENKGSSGDMDNQAPIDSLVTAYLNAWNKGDVEAIASTMDPRIVVLNESQVHRELPNIASEWIRGGVKVIRNIEAEEVVKESSGNLAYYAGHYKLDFVNLAGALEKESGNYSIIWKKNELGQWKIKLIQVEKTSRTPIATDSIAQVAVDSIAK